jgi:hypothetical protein
MGTPVSLCIWHKNILPYDSIAQVSPHYGPLSITIVELNCAVDIGPHPLRADDRGEGAALALRGELF